MDIDNKLWQFSVAFYAQPGVAEKLLTLQNEHAVSVNQVLFGFWLASENQALTGLPAETDKSAQWQKQVVAPLRQIRFWLKQQRTDEQLKIATVDCYRQLLEAELATEQVELAFLFSNSAYYSEVVASGNAVRSLALQNINFYIESRAQSPADCQSSDAHRDSLLQALLDKYCLMHPKVED